MGRMSALTSNNILENSKEFNLLEDKMLKLQKTIRDCVYSGKVSEFKKKKLIELLENLSGLKFDIGKVDNLELLEFLKNPTEKYHVYQAIEFANGEINPKSYEYQEIFLSNKE